MSWEAQKSNYNNNLNEYYYDNSQSYPYERGQTPYCSGESSIQRIEKIYSNTTFYEEQTYTQRYVDFVKRYFFRSVDGLSKGDAWKYVKNIAIPMGTWIFPLQIVTLCLWEVNFPQILAVTLPCEAALFSYSAYTFYKEEIENE